jgi:alkylation response protein AidB-like acyl-CoA dehydrogenase
MGDKLGLAIAPSVDAYGPESVIDTSTDTAFRTTTRRWIQDNAPPGLQELADWSKLLLGGAHWWAFEEQMQTEPYRLWERRLLDEHLICANWPKAFGGRDLTISQTAIFDEECLRANVPRVVRQQGESFVGPAILVHGTQEQKDRFLGGIVSGSDKYGQGFSEPDHGSDLASLQTKGSVDGDRLIINGQKIWTTAAMHANVLFVLCRTDQSAPKHRGISYVIVPMENNVGRITIQPIRQITGEAKFCLTFFDEAVAPVANIIGGLNSGWRVAMTTLGNERAGRVHAKYLVYEREFWGLHSLVRSRGTLTDAVRLEFSLQYSRLRALQASAWRMAAKVNSGGEPGVEASLDKMASSEYHRGFGEFAMNVLGCASMVLPDGENYALDEWQQLFLGSRSETIASGTSEIQRNVLAERFLGLPREPTGS